jgi:hypothetical protein
MNSDTYFAIFPGVFTNPSRSWEVIKDIDIKPARFFLLVGLPFIFFGALGRSLSDQNLDVYVNSSFGLLFLVHIITHLTVLLLGSWMIARMSGTYGLEPGFYLTLRLSVTAYIPFLLSQLLAAIAAAISAIALAGLIYSLFLFWNGAPQVLDIPKNRLAGFTLLAFFIFLGLGFIGLYLFRMIIFAPVTLS